ncbi:G patch domain-containing protein 2-like [Gigantopelta aegis]|uniref:G patch domain-containing protein 2-like n=1 Tax=Gigantopelta aegis TaxID=1735272 RepID=UPI001B8887DA|nr:G patch domain-containing protein 2-like [Gigantopelta aegis]
MDNSIVNEFENLRMFSKRTKLLRMDELVQDLTLALEETMKGQKSSQSENLTPGTMARRLQKKRKGKRQRSNPNSIWNCGVISEASESSLDEALKDYIDTVAQLSDSDDITMARNVHRLTVPISDPIPPVESDSVTENFSPMRPPRRRRKFKSMAFDSSSPQADDSAVFLEPSVNRYKLRSKTLQDSNSNIMSDTAAAPSSSTTGATNHQSILPGKRKRNNKSRNDFHPIGENTDSLDGMDMSSYSHESSSLSSSESDGLVTNDEGREADDEQSDFFHEPGPACGIAGIVPWWENERVTDSNVMMDPNFESILTGTFEHLPKASQLSFKARVSRLMASNGREMRLGRRKLKGKMPSYTMTRFIQDRQMWSQMQSCYNPSGWHSSSFPPMSTECKRRRKATSSNPLDEGLIGKHASPISDENIGNKMLQNMGWNPGSGLGPGGSGIKNPVQAYMRAGRKGLGYDSNNRSDI